ncbi:MAG: tetratricopeptide repeat protein [Cyanobacteria bacterium J06638_6]
MHIYQQQQPRVCPLPISGPRTTTATPDSAGQVIESTLENTLSRLATAAVKRQQYPQALRLLSQLLERHPQRAMHHSNRGLVQLRLGNPEAALADCDLAVALDPSLDQAYNNRAMCHAALGNLATAIDDYNRAVDLNPFNSRARINLGATLRQAGAFDSALDCFDEALMFKQLPEFIYAERGRTYHLRGDWNCAMADYRRTLAAATTMTPGPQTQALVQRVQRYIAELVPQQSCA